MSASDTPKGLVSRGGTSLSLQRHALAARARRDLGLITRRVGVYVGGLHEDLFDLLMEGLGAQLNGVSLVPLRTRADRQAACATRSVDYLVTDDCNAPSRTKVPALVLLSWPYQEEQLEHALDSGAWLTTPVDTSCISAQGPASSCKPLAASIRTLMEMTAPRDTLPAGSCVLWADDNPCIRDMLGEVFRSWGIEFIAARDGAEAIDLVHEHVDRLDVIVSDYGMPGTNGPEFFNAVAPLISGRIPLVMEDTGGQTTWWLDALSWEAVYALHATISVPLDFNKLWTMAERCLRIRSAMQRARPLGMAS